MNGGEQYSLDMALLKIREEKRKRKMRSERAVILFVVWLLVFRVCGIMRVDGNSMRPACHPGDIVFFLRILPDGVGYGDAVILKDASGEYLIKRIAGLPGDVMEVDREGHLTRNGAKVQETEEGGWVHDIDLWMIRECCRWFTRFAEYGITRINVNLSPQTCMVETVWEEISSCLDRYGLQHGKIWLEMTELGKSADNGKLLETAHRLQDKKFNLVMDDFGKGESNFVQLMDFEFQSIKLDKELVWGIGNRKMGMPIVQTLLVFAQRNHIWVTAEGIETREQAEQLEKLGCNFLQGYLISRPLPADRCVEFVADWEKKDILAQ